MSQRVVVVGAGILGLTAAWRMTLAGHGVTLIDPTLEPGGELPPGTGGSHAALGVLMARVFHRSSGRAWRLRQESHRLWTAWLAELEGRGHRIPRRRGVLLLAADERELERQEQLGAERSRLGIPMECLGPADLAGMEPALPGRPLGGLLSPEDGQVDPRPLLGALQAEIQRAGGHCRAARVVGVERDRPWRVHLEGGCDPAGGEGLEADRVVLALGVATAPLLAGLGHALPLAPVLGQALELELAAQPGWNWPGVVVWRGHNLVPRPDLAGGRRLWLGATLEPGDQRSATALAALRLLGGDAPPWLRKAEVMRHWQGLRAQPVGQPAPVLAEPEPGLLVASGPYRNGVLLAPAMASWLCERITQP